MPIKQAPDYELNALLYSQAPEYNRKKADKYMFLIEATKGMSKAEIGAFVYLWNLENPDKRTSVRTVYRAKSTWEKEGITGILGKLGMSKGKTKVPDEAYEHFKSLYLREGAPSVQSCWLQVVGKHVGKKEEKPKEMPDTWPKAFEPGNKYS